MNEFKAGVCINYVSIVIRLSTAFLLTPFVISSLGMEEYGLFMLSNSIILWLSLTDFGLGTCVNKYVSTYQAQRKYGKQAHFLGQATVLFSLLGLITLGTGLTCYCYLTDFFPNLSEAQHHTLKTLYLLTLSNLILSFPLRPITSLSGAYLKFIVPGITNLLLSLLNTGLTILLLFHGYKAIGLTTMSVSLGIIGLIWNIYYVIRYLGVRLTFRKPDIPLYREMFVFSFWILLNQLMDLFYWRAGSPIVAHILGTEAVTLFTLGISFSQYFMTASTAISGVIQPKVMHMVALNASRTELMHLMIRAGRIQLCILSIILLGFMTLGQNFLHLWVGHSLGNQTQTVWLGALLVLVPLLVPSTQNVGVAILQALSIHKGRAIILFYTSLICVVLGYILTLYFGSIGMFAGTAVSLFIGQGIMINLYYTKKVGFSMRCFFKETYVPFILPALVLSGTGYGVMYAYPCNTWFHLAIAAIAYGSFSIVLLTMWYLHKDERDMIFSPLRRIFNRKLFRQP